MQKIADRWMPIARIAGLLAVALGASAERPVSAQTDQIVEEYPCQHGDQLTIRSNSGKIVVRPWAQSKVQVRYRAVSPSTKVLFQKNGERMLLHAYSHGMDDDTVDMEIHAPIFLALIIQGIDPLVDIEKCAAGLRIDTLRGDILLKDVTCDAIVFSKTGSITFRTSAQPRNRIDLISRTGNIHMGIADDVDVRIWAEGEGRFVWNGKDADWTVRRPPPSNAPLIVASSNQGDIDIQYSRVPPAFERMESTRSSRAEVEAESEAGTGSETAVKASKPSQEEGTRQRPAPGLATRAFPSNAVFRVNVDWVHLNISVLDQQSKTNVTDLHRSDFEVLENGAIQEIEHFEATESPFHLLLLLDLSASTEPYLKLIRRATLGFVDQLREDDRIGIAVFSERTHLIQPLTANRRAIHDAVDRFQSVGGTAFYHSLNVALDEYVSNVPERKAIVIFTDGVDDTLRGGYAAAYDVTFREVFRQLQASDCIVYAIFLDTEAEQRKLNSKKNPVDDRILPDYVYNEARTQLELIAEQTGGRLFSPTDPDQLGPIYGEIARDLRYQYTLGFKSKASRRDGRFRRLEVRVVGHLDYAIRHRQGYLGN